MTDPEPRPTPEEEARVRRLLADARHDEAMPPEVVARLDRVLAGLAEQTPAGEATVTPLATRRRRATRVLVAAAAVVVVGIGLGQVVDRGTHSSDEGASAPAADSAVSGEAESQGEAAPGAGGSASGDRLAPQADAPVVRIRPESFAAGARMARDSRAVAQDHELSDGALSAYGECRTAAWGEGTFVPVRYGRAPAVLVLRRAAGDTQVADLFLCGEPDPVRSVTLPVR